MVSFIRSSNGFVLVGGCGCPPSALDTFSDNL